MRVTGAIGANRTLELTIRNMNHDGETNTKANLGCALLVFAFLAAIAAAFFAYQYLYWLWLSATPFVDEHSDEVHSRMAQFGFAFGVSMLVFLGALTFLLLGCRTSRMIPPAQ